MSTSSLLGVVWRSVVEGADAARPGRVLAEAAYRAGRGRPTEIPARDRATQEGRRRGDLAWRALACPDCLPPHAVRQTNPAAAPRRPVVNSSPADPSTEPDPLVGTPAGRESPRLNASPANISHAAFSLQKDD